MSENANLAREPEMLKAIYDFKATFAKTLSFNEGDHFLLLKPFSKDRNWWNVINRRGQIGFVPSNYVAAASKVDAEFIASFINDCFSALKDENKYSASVKEEIVTQLKEKMLKLNLTVKSPSKKPPAPKPPARFDGINSPNGMSSPSLEIRSMQSDDGDKQNGSNEIKDHSDKVDLSDHGSELSENSEAIKPNAMYEIVQAVRKETQLSHEMSKVAVETVLVHLKEFLPGGAARSIVDALLASGWNSCTCPSSALVAGPDAVRMRSALDALCRAANDAQQRGWALHDDAHDIQTQLLELINVMSNADLNITRHALSSHKYVYVTTLVQYYQMETRWPLRQLLLQAFGIMCGLERTALVTLAISLLPAEIARDMRDNRQAVSRLSHSALLMSMVLSMGDRLPVTHFEQLGEDFITFLLELIEEPPENDIDEQIPDLFLTLLLAYNLQFENPQENIILNALEKRENAKVFTEKLLLLLNREEDPVRIFDHEPAPPHSVLKLCIDLFSRKECAVLFYTNDVKVMIDIVVRQLADLSAGDQRRAQYLRLCEGVIANTDYGSHTHRRDDLLRCFARIFCEEGEVSLADQALVRNISNTWPEYFKA